MALDTRPKKVDILHWAGDTLTVKVTAPASLTDGKVWDAHIKTAVGAAVTAEWAITPPTISGGPAYLVLDSATTAAMAAGQPVVYIEPDSRAQRAGVEPRAVQQFVGVWDCQVSFNGSDPVRTLVQGTLTIEMDVTQP